MNPKVTLPELFAGIDNIIFDERPFDPSKEDIIKICRFFSLGELKGFEKEKGITVSHSNHFVFLRTTAGNYALKFYPPDSGNMLATEYAINRYLIKRNFLTPQMHAGKTGRPSLKISGWLATCFTYIDGTQAWQHIHKPFIIHQINKSMSSLKEMILTLPEQIPFFKQDRLTNTADDAAKTSHSLTTYDQKKLIESILIKTCRIFQAHQPLFKRQWLHNNATLTNFLIVKRNVYALDLMHIREDYILSDLASMVISCLFLGTPRNTITLIIKDHFKQNNIRNEMIVVLNTLVTMGLIREYLKNIQSERSIDLNNKTRGTVKSYLTHLSARKRLIVDVVTKITAQKMLFKWNWA